MTRVLVATSASTRLAAAREFAGSHPAGTEILLLAPHREAADDLARDLARQTKATFGLHRFSVPQLVARLASESLSREGLAPATQLGQQAVAARLAFQIVEEGRAPRWEEVSRCPGFPGALAKSLSELRQQQVAVAAVGSAAAASELADLLQRYGDACHDASVADRTAMLRLATESLEGGGHDWLAHTVLVLVDVPVTTAVERAFFAALAKRGHDTLVTVPAGETWTHDAWRDLGFSVEVEAVSQDAKTSVARLRAHLFAEDPPKAAKIDDTVRFFSAPGERRECVEVVRGVLKAAGEGVPFDQMAVFLRAPEIYSGLLEAALRRARIPAYFARGAKRPDPSGRAFLALLACAGDGLSARRFAEYLSFAQVPDTDAQGAPPTQRHKWVGPREEELGSAAAAAAQTRPGDPAPAVQLDLFAEPIEASPPPEPEPDVPVDADEQPQIGGALRAPWRWEEYLVEASVIGGGAERWERRLRGLERELRFRLEELGRIDPESNQLDALGRDLTNLGHLERFALPVIRKLADLPAKATWGEWLHALDQLAPVTLRRPERVQQLLAEMQPMAAIGPVTLDEVRTVLTPRLANLQDDPPATRYGCVFVGNPDHARGRSFQVVFVPGLAERVFPQRLREDPLLHDTARRQIDAGLDTQEERAQQERMQLRLAVTSATDRVVLSYPRVELAKGRPRVPSFYGLDVQRAIRGELPSVELFEREAEADADARLAWPAPSNPEHSIDPVEHDLSVLDPLLHDTKLLPDEAQGRARYLLELSEHVARSLRSRWMRWRKSWNPEDGLVRLTDETRPILEKQRPKARPFSPTALERYAACPYRFYLSAILRLQPREDVVPPVQLDPLTRGRLLHEVQAEALRALKEARNLPITPTSVYEASKVLDTHLDRVAERYRDELTPPILRVWHDEIEALRRDLHVWIENLARRSDEWHPIYFELAFGLPLGSDRDPRSTAEAVVLDGGWQLRGAVDMVERSAKAEEYRVIDHKTGGNRHAPGTIVGQGEVLQPVLYSLAVQKVLSAAVSSGVLSFCTSRGGFSEVVVPMSDFARHYATSVFEVIDRAVEQGFLPPAPREGACRFCDFRPVCGPWEETRTATKHKEPLQDLEGLRQHP